MNLNTKFLKYISLILLTLHSAILSISMHHARTRSDEIFHSSTAVLMPEFIKLIICLVLVFYEQNKNLKKFFQILQKTIISNSSDTFKIIIPSLLYNIQNNLLYVAASHLDAATNQVIYQMKILTTAIFAVILLHRKLLKTQIAALISLIIGIVLVQLSETKFNQNDLKNIAASRKQNRLFGIIAALLAGFLSGFAGIYFEKMLKNSVLSVWMRNIQLSLLSIPLGLLTCFINDANNIITKGFFFGYDTFIWYLIFLQACGGLIIAAVIKYADNILKSFATSFSIIISCIASIYLFNFSLTFQFILGASLVIASMFLYGYTPKEMTKKKN